MSQKTSTRRGVPTADALPPSGAERTGRKLPERTAVVRMLPAVVIVVLLGAVVLLSVPAFLAPAADPKASVPPGQVGTLDHSFRAAGVEAPTGRKTEASKLWFNDASWWGAMFRPERDATTINRYDPDRDAWDDTGVVIDDRNGSQVDMLWTGEHLYAVSGGTDPASDGDAPVIVRMSYDAGSGTYRMDRGFPVRLAARGSEVFTLDRDETGRLWVTWTSDRKVWVTHSAEDDAHWVAASVIPVPQAQGITADDVSSVVAYEGHIGIMWSDQRDGAMWWAATDAGTEGPWSVTAVVRGLAMADDHMSLRSMDDDPSGLVVGAIKTSRNDLPTPDPADPLIMLVVLRRDGTWSQSVVSTVRENETRPLVVLDADHRMVHLITTAPCCAGGTIYTRTTSLDSIQFAPRVREPFMRRAGTSQLNNPTSGKQPATAATGLLVIAADDALQRYMHNYLALPGARAAKPSPSAIAPLQPGQPNVAAPLKEVAFDGFETGTLDRWTVAAGPGGSVAVDAAAARTDAFGAALSADGSKDGFADARLDLPAGGPAMSVDLDFRVLRDGLPDGNVPLVRLLAADGTRILAVYRQNTVDGRVWLRTSKDRSVTLGKAELAAWGHLAVTMFATETGTTAEVRLNGNFVGRTVFPEPLDTVALLQIGNDTTSQAFSLTIDGVRVLR